MPKFGNSNARAGKGAPKSTNKGGAPKAKAAHRKGDTSTSAPKGGKSLASRSKTERNFEPSRGKSRSNPSESSSYSRGGSSRQNDSRSSRFAADDSGKKRTSNRFDFDPNSRPAGRKPRHGSERFNDSRGNERNSADNRSGSRSFSIDAPRNSRGSRFESDSRPARKFDREERPARTSRFESDSRPSRDSRDSRPTTDRRFDRDERPARASRFESDSRPARKIDRDERPSRDSRDSRDSDSRKSSSRNSHSREFPQRSFDSARGSRNFDSAERSPSRSDRVARDRDRDRSFEGARKSNKNGKAFFEDQKLERLQSVDQSTVDLVGNFAELNLHPKLLAALESMGVTAPFPIQAATIPAAIGGMDVLGRGKTGSGKTVAFTVPLITKLIAGGSQPRKAGKPRALILAPTRELADQIDRTAHALAKSVGFFTACIYGGVPQRRQENMMSRGTDIVVATPGRLEDLMAQGIVDLSEVETIVIDEADHMCDLGFIEPVKRIMRATGDSQKLLFSATLDKEVDALVKEFLPAPFVYEVPNEEEDVANITHRVFTVDAEDRSQVLLRLVQGEGKSLIFARTKMTAERLSESLTAAGVPAARLHGDLNQNQRNRNLERFTKGYVRVLVATDVAARGIHVDDVALVIQVDPPEEYKTYLHRAGRTGRAGKEGTVITLIPRNRRRRMEEMLDRAERDGIFTEVRPANPILEELAGPIAPPPAQEVLDFGDSRGGRGDRSGSSHKRRAPGSQQSFDSAGRSRGGSRGGYGKRDGGSAGRSRPNRPGKNARARDNA